MGEQNFFHGGPRGLRVILPSEQTGVASTAAFGALAVCRRDRIYVTADPLLALAFASLVPNRNGTVYQVVPVDPKPDPDCTLPGLSFEALSAEIIREIRPKGSQLKKARKIMIAD